MKALLLLVLLLSWVPQPAHEDTLTYIVFLKPGPDPVYVTTTVLNEVGVEAQKVLVYLGPGFIANLTESQLRQVEKYAIAIFPSTEVRLEGLAEEMSGNVKSFSYNAGLNYTGRGVTVAVIDTGINYTLPELGGALGVKVIGGYDFVDKDEDPMDLMGHGTAVASIIAANGSRLVGVAPGAKLLAYRVSGMSDTIQTYLIVEALERALEDGADIVNLSLGGEIHYKLLWVAGYRAQKHGTILVAAAGNDGPDTGTIYTPASIPYYIAVGSATSPWTDVLLCRAWAGDYKLRTARPMNNSVTGIVEGEVVNVGHGRVQDVEGLDLRGKIAVSFRDRKTYFGEMEYNVASRGAIGLIVVNDENMSLNGALIHPNISDYSPRIPVISVAKFEGEEILSRSTAKIEVFKSGGRPYPSIFSSRGTDDPLKIKPEILAYGEKVPALTASGVHLLSGTSMAAPQVTGAIALLLEKFGRLTFKETLSALMLSAIPLDNYPGYVQGAGLLNVTRLLEIPFVVDPPYLILYSWPGHEGSETVSISFFAPPQEVRWTGPLEVRESSNYEFILSGNGEGYYYMKVVANGFVGNYPVMVVGSDFGLKVTTKRIYTIGLPEGTKVKVEVTFPDGDVQEFDGEAPRVAEFQPYESGLYLFKAYSANRSAYLRKEFLRESVKIPNPPPYMPIYMASFVITYSLILLIFRFRSRARREVYASLRAQASS